MIKIQNLRFYVLSVKWKMGELWNKVLKGLIMNLQYWNILNILCDDKKKADLVTSRGSDLRNTHLSLSPGVALISWEGKQGIPHVWPNLWYWNPTKNQKICFSQEKCAIIIRVRSIQLGELSDSCVIIAATQCWQDICRSLYMYKFIK